MSHGRVKRLTCTLFSWFIWTNMLRFSSSSRLINDSYVFEVKGLCIQGLFFPHFFSMTWFRAFRGDFGFSFYGEKRTPVTIDIQLVSAIYACVLVTVAAIIVAIGIRGKEVSYVSESSTFSRRRINNFIFVFIHVIVWVSHL